MRRFVGCLSIVVGVAALAFLFASFISYETLQPLGTLVRRPDDVTPERYTRYLHVTRGLAVAFGVLAVWLSVQRESVAAFVREVITGPLRWETAGWGERPDWREGGVLLAILAVAAGLRLYRLNEPMAYDEAYTWVNFASRPWYEAIGDYNSTNNHLLNTLLVHVCGRLFGPQEWALRLPVLLAGCALPAMVWLWGRAWRGTAIGLTAAALVAVSPALISYSVDARGYMFVALAAITLDACAGRLQRGDSARAWLGAGVAITLGLCAMPIMAYAVAATLGWFLITPRMKVSDCADFENDSWRNRLRSWLPVLGLSALGVGLFYTPAYLFRGLHFLRDPIMQSAVGTDFVRQLGQSWLHAFAWWADGAIATPVWLLLAVFGAALWSATRRDWTRWLMPFLLVLGLNILQHVAPPPRIYLHLAPWIYLLCAGGAAGLWRLAYRSRDPNAPATFGAAQWLFPAVVLVAGGWTSLRRDIQFFPAERRSYQSIPAVIARLEMETEETTREHQILLAPLPCDLPAIFYMNRRGFRVPINVRPAPGDRVWLMTRPGERIEEVLGSGLIDMPDLAGEFTPWELVQEFRELTLWTARRRLPDADHSLQRTIGQPDRS